MLARAHSTNAHPVLHCSGSSDGVTGCSRHTRPPRLRRACRRVLRQLRRIPLERIRDAVYVTKQLNGDIVLRGQKVERRDRFFADARLPSAQRVELVDCKGSGYLELTRFRGHIILCVQGAENAQGQTAVLGGIQTANG